MKECDVSGPASAWRQVLNDAKLKSNAIDEHDDGKLLSGLTEQPAKIEKFPDRRAQQQNNHAWRYLVKSEKNKVCWPGLRT